MGCRFLFVVVRETKVFDLQIVDLRMYVERFYLDKTEYFRGKFFSRACNTYFAKSFNCIISCCSLTYAFYFAVLFVSNLTFGTSGKWHVLCAGH